MLINTLSDFGGIRRINRIADEVTTNLGSLEKGLWDKLFDESYYSGYSRRLSINDERRHKRLSHQGQVQNIQHIWPFLRAVEI
jgi:hypothetical protein